MNDLPDKTLLRVDEVAAYFNVSPKTIYLWCDHGLLEFEKIVGCIRIPMESVLSFRLANKLKNI
jgi:excisionase family DNA binding protein